MGDNSAAARPVKLTVVLPAEVAGRLDAFAADERRSRSNAATVLIEKGLRESGFRDPGSDEPGT